MVKVIYTCDMCGNDIKRVSQEYHLPRLIHTRVGNSIDKTIITTEEMVKERAHLCNECANKIAQLLTPIEYGGDE